jgi:hypothetical protein
VPPRESRKKLFFGSGPRDPRSVLIVEGINPYYFILRMFGGAIERNRIYLFDGEGRDNLDRALSLIIDTDGFNENIRTVGLLYDAEADAQQTAHRIREALRRVGLPVPQQPLVPARPSAGDASGIATAYLILPHGRESGCFEHALLPGYRNSPRVDGAPATEACVDAALKCAGRPERITESGRDNWVAKAKVHTLIALSERPEATLAESGLCGVWDVSHPSIDPIAQLIESLGASSQ